MKPVKNNAARYIVNSIIYKKRSYYLIKKSVANLLHSPWNFTQIALQIYSICFNYKQKIRNIFVQKVQNFFGDFQSFS